MLLLIACRFPLYPSSDGCGTSTLSPITVYLISLYDILNPVLTVTPTVTGQLSRWFSHWMSCPSRVVLSCHITVPFAIELDPELCVAVVHIRCCLHFEIGQPHILYFGCREVVRHRPPGLGHPHVLPQRGAIQSQSQYRSRRFIDRVSECSLGPRFAILGDFHLDSH
jgi:hypothetical protein